MPASDLRAGPRSGAESRLCLIQPQTSLTFGFVRAVALKTGIGKNWSDVAIELDAVTGLQRQTDAASETDGG